MSSLLALPRRVEASETSILLCHLLLVAEVWCEWLLKAQCNCVVVCHGSILLMFTSVVFFVVLSGFYLNLNMRRHEWICKKI